MSAGKEQIIDPRRLSQAGQAVELSAAPPNESHKPPKKQDESPTRPYTGEEKFMKREFSCEVGGKPVTLTTGHLAKQATGAVTIRAGDTIVLVTATAKEEPKESADFLPLSVDYIEKTFAAGKIPGGFFKREGRPKELETLTSRFIDRPIRPLFPVGYFHETQVIATVLSADIENEPDVLAMIGASAALMISPVPFLGPIAGLRIARNQGKLIVNPAPSQLESSDIDLIVAGTEDAVVMVEGGAAEVPEKELLEAISFAHESMQPILKLQGELADNLGPKKWEPKPLPEIGRLEGLVKTFLEDRLPQALGIQSKKERSATLTKLEEEMIQQFLPMGKSDPGLLALRYLLKEEEKIIVRKMILNKKHRIDGRGLKEIRPIHCEVGLLPRTHGSALFTRGETQALVVSTLGSSEDQQLIDALGEEYYKHFMLHYNFPPFSTGEVKPLRSPGRREVGHGVLAERALARMLPLEEAFPYTIRVVSEILESNGSSSMATVCGGSLSLMDAGVPIREAVAGIAMGLIKEENRHAILSDILGDEDHLGDMDFKVAGTRNGVTALQMDIKIAGLSEDILKEALEQAREGRMEILEKMGAAIGKPRSEISIYAPKIEVLKIHPDKIGALIGPGGKMIRAIIAETGAKIDVEDDGTVKIYAVDQKSGEEAAKRVKELTAVPEVGKLYRGQVVKIVDFGAFVEIMPSVEGLLHISQLAAHRVRDVSEILKEGDEVVVKVLEIDEATGKIRLSRKEALGKEAEVVN